MKSETNLKRWGFFYVLLFLIVLFATFAATGHCQVSVTPNCALGKCQFFDRNGKPLASGKVFSYDAGTTTLRPTYQDAGGIAQNTDPISLDAGGYASVWLANQSYKFCVYSSAMVLQYPCQDGITGYFGLLNLANTWTFPQTFTLPLIDLSTDNQFIIGALGAQATLDFPPPATNITLHFPNTTDTMVGRATPDTLTNKTLTSPTINAVPVTGIPVQTLCSLAPVTVNANTTGQQVVQVCSLPSAVLNSLQKSIRITWEVSTAPGSSISNQVSYGIAPTITTSTGQVCNATTASAATCILSFTCTTLVAGSSGSLGCGGSASGTLTASFTPWTTVSVDLTGVVQVASLCAFGSASASNSCTGNQLIVEQLN